MRFIYDWLYYCFYCLAFTKGLKFERAAFGINLTLGFFFSGLIISLISKSKLIVNGMFLLVMYFLLILLVFKIHDIYFIKNRRYRIAIDRFAGTAPYFKFLFALLAASLLFASFFSIFYVISILP